MKCFGVPSRYWSGVFVSKSLTPIFILLIAGKDAHSAHIRYGAAGETVGSSHFFHAENLVRDTQLIYLRKEITPAHVSEGYNYV
jgi:hypothetical protein